jgi:hypothetical protein
MCYSKYWLSEDERRQREAKAKEAEAKRAETIRAMLVESERRAEAGPSTTRVSAPANSLSPWSLEEAPTRHF